MYLLSATTQAEWPGANLMLLFQNVPGTDQAPATNAGTAQPASAPAAAGSPPSMMYTVLPMFAVMAVILFMSNRRQKKEQEARKSMKKGERVVSTSGLIGELVDIDEKVAKVKLAPGITVQMLPGSISPLVDAATPAKDDKALADLKEAKATADKK
jgi:preprotein translocase subunit YajC